MSATKTYDSKFRWAISTADQEIEDQLNALEELDDDDYHTFEDEPRINKEIRAELKCWQLTKKLLELAKDIPAEKIMKAQHMVLLNSDKA